MKCRLGGGIKQDKSSACYRSGERPLYRFWPCDCQHNVKDGRLAQRDIGRKEAVATAFLIKTEATKCVRTLVFHLANSQISMLIS